MSPDWLREFFTLASVILGSFGAGVAWAAYRAVDWVDRMRAWAASVEESSHSGVQQ